MQKLTVRNPYDDAVIEEIDTADSTRLAGAMDRAAEIFEETRYAPSHKRAAWCQAISDGIASRAEELAQTICVEAGKPIRYARGEVDRATDTFKLAAEEAKRIGGEILDIDAAAAGEGRMGIVRRFPRGPILGISPFNFPLNLVSHKVAPAMAVGNPVMLKPSSSTPLTALKLGEIAADVPGLPEGFLQVLPVRGGGIEPVVADDRVTLITFTGSAEIGWALKARARRKHVALELGGDAAVIVEPDADLDDAAKRTAIGAFAYAGQVCISVQRILVHASVHAAFTKRLLAAISELGCGDPADEATVCGPVIDAYNADRVAEWIAEAEAKGAQRLCGGERTGNVVTPTVLAEVPPDAKVAYDEVFGPVATLASYTDFEEVLARVNASRFGLQAGVFTNNLKHAMRAFEVIEVGGVIHNDSPMFRVDQMPYGGVKESGFGREGIRYAIEDHTEPRLLVLRP